MGIKLVSRGKVREMYGLRKESSEGEFLDFECETPHYIVTGGMVLERGTDAVMGTLFDNDEMSRLKELKERGGNIDIILSTMFLGYLIPMEETAK